MNDLSRAEFIKLLAAAALAGCAPPTMAAPPALRRRAIPKSGEMLPVVGLGTWQAFDIDPGGDEMKDRKEVLRRLLDGGGSVIDTSPMYGEAEDVVGTLLGGLGRRSEAFIATKVWTTGENAGISQMEYSQRVLQTEVIDLMQVHNLKDWRTHIKTMRRWKEEGKIRYIGITHYTVESLEALSDVIEREPLDFVQAAYSIGVREAENRLLPLAAERGVAVLVNRPYEYGAVFKRVRGRPLPEWASEIECNSWGQIFLKFILANPAITCVIPGTSKPHHMADNLGAGLGRLPDDRQRKKILDLWLGL